MIWRNGKMKKNFSAKILVGLLAIILCASLLACAFSSSLSVPAYADDYTDTDISGKTMADRLSYAALKEDFKKQEAKENYFRKETMKTLKDAKYWTELSKNISSSIGELIINGENADHIANMYEIGKTVLKIGANCLGPVGGIVAEGAFSLFDSLLSIGESSESEHQQMLAQLNDQFDALGDRVDEIQEEISKLSNHVDASTDKILKELSKALEGQFAKQELAKFFSSRDGNFDFNLFKEYLYASADATSPDYSKYAYYNKLLRTLNDPHSTEADIKEAYDKLYVSLGVAVNSGAKAPIDTYYDYILKHDSLESIQYYYYEYLSSNRSSMEEHPELEALDFALDIYNTASFADYCLTQCNSYQIQKMREQYGADLDWDSKYYYGSDESRDYILYSDMLAFEYKVADRKEKLFAQILSDITYIINIENSYSVGADGEIRYCTNNTEGTFGKVSYGDTLYLNTYFEELIAMFDLDRTAFSYTFTSNSVSYDCNGIYTVTGHAGDTIVGKVYYEGYLLYSIPFTVEDSRSFSGGTGTVSDPFIISSPAQFSLIYKTEDYTKKSYKLVSDLVLTGEYRPIGTEKNQFEGTFFGNGHTITGLNIVDEECCGLFGYIHSTGSVLDLTIESGTFRIGSSSENKLVAGAFAGICQGTLYNCHVVNGTKVEVLRTTDTPNYSLTTEAGGLIGELSSDHGSGSVSYCSFEGSTVKVRSERNYQTNNDSKNSNTVFVGGIAGNVVGGTISNTLVDEKSVVDGYAESVCNDNISSRHPYVKVYVGGIAGRAVEGAVNNAYSAVETQNLICDLKADNTGFLGGEDENHCERHSDAYVASFNETQNDSIKRSDRPVLTPVAPEIELVCGEQVYEYGSSLFDKTGLNVKVDGQDADFVLLGCYGFNTRISNYKINNGKRVYEDAKAEVTVLLNVSSDRYTGIVAKTLEITVLQCQPTALEVAVEPEKTVYNYGEEGTEIALGGASFVLRYQDGWLEDVTAEAELSPNTLIIDKDVVFGIKNEENHKKQKVSVTYGAWETSFEITITCTHQWGVTVVPNHCEHLGYTEYTCSICGASYKTDYSKERLPHSGVIYDSNSAEAKALEGYRGSSASTCVSEGYTGDVFCTLCGKIVSFGEVLPITAHTYTAEHSNSLSHICTVCGTSAQHMFKTVENTEKVICACIYCGYEKEMEQNSREAIKNLPRVVVSDGYALPGENEVTVFVELQANVGITSAYFSVNFDERLELVRCDYGNVLNKRSADAFSIYSDHVNVILFTTDADATDGVLLKLTFRTPENAAIDDVYEIHITNRVDESGKIDKFTDKDNKEIDFLATGGKITVVGHLPGDINGDGSLDLVDVVIVAKYLALDAAERPAFIADRLAANPLFDLSYADVDLDGFIYPRDVNEMLRFIAGGYEARVLASRFGIILNYNDGTSKEQTITVDYNHGNGTFEGLPEEVILDGYRFDGWYTDFIGGEKVTELSKVFYNKDQIQQTLYARYTQNTVTFDSNGASEGTKTSLTWSNSGDYEHDGTYVILGNGTLAKVSTVTFKDDKSGSTDCITKDHSFLGWATAPDGTVDNTLENIRLNALGLIESVDVKASGCKGIGELTLYAVWSVECIDRKTPSEQTGYVFNNWTDGQASWDGRSEYDVTQDVTFTAEWSPIHYTIRYNGNEGTTAGGETEYTDGIERYAGKTASLHPNNFVRTGYKFIGWSRTPNNIPLYNPEEAVSGYIGTGTETVVELYACWKPIEYSIVFNGNGNTSGSMSAIYNVKYGQEMRLPQNNFKRDGYTFSGWATAPTGNKVYEDIETVINMTAEYGTVHLYAKWVAKSYTALLELSASSIKTCPELNVQSVDVIFDTKTHFPVPTADYYEFVGWYLDNNGYEQITDSAGNMLNTWNIDKNQTLYAHWKKVDKYNDYEYINTKSEFANISPTGKTLLVADIDMEGFEWSIIEQFSGKLIGDGHTVSNIAINNQNAQYVGLFATNNGNIESVIFNNIIVTYEVSDSYDNAYIGVIAGHNKGSIRSCVVKYSNITCWLYKKVGTSSTLKISVGGIAGKNTSTIYDCCLRDTKILGQSSIGISDGAVEANVGGIVGMNVDCGTVEKCNANTNSIEAIVYGGKTWTATRYRTYARAGGIVGYNSASIISCQTSNNSLNAEYSTQQGGAPDNHNSTGSIAGTNDGTIS